MGKYTSEEIVSFIQEWIRGGVNLTNGINLVTFDPNCKVLINETDPQCNKNSQEQPTTTQEQPATSVSPTLSLQTVFTPFSIGLCAAVALLVIIVVLLGGSAVCCYCSRRKTLIGKLAGDPPLRQR